MGGYQPVFHVVTHMLGVTLARVADPATAGILVGEPLAGLNGGDDVGLDLFNPAVLLVVQGAADLGLGHRRPGAQGTRSGIPAALAKHDQGHGIAQGFDLPVGARTTPKFSGSARVGHQPVAVDDDRVLVFQDFGVATGQRPKTALGADRRPAVHVMGRPPAADQGGQQHGHILLAGSEIVAGNVEPVGVPPRGHGPFRHGLLQGQPDGIGDAFRRGGGAVHMRSGLLGVGQAAGRADIDLDRPVQPGVVGRRQLGEHHDAQIHPGQRVGRVRVDEVGQLARAVEANVQRIARDPDGWP